jgi:hypothetical protein
MLVSSVPQEKVNVTHASAWCLANALLWELASALRSCAQQSPFQLHCVPLRSTSTSPSTALQKKILSQICMHTDLALNFRTHSNLDYPSALEPTWRTAIIQNQLVNLVFPLPFSAGRKCSPKARRLSSHSVACFHKPTQLYASPQSQHQVSFCATFNSDCGGEERSASAWIQHCL